MIPKQSGSDKEACTEPLLRGQVVVPRRSPFKGRLHVAGRLTSDSRCANKEQDADCARSQASAAVETNSSVFWVITRRKVA